MLPDPATELNDLIDRLIVDWPSELRDADPGRADALARHQWMTRMAPISERLDGAKKRRLAGTPAKAPGSKRLRVFSTPGDVRW